MRRDAGPVVRGLAKSGALSKAVARPWLGGVLFGMALLVRVGAAADSGLYRWVDEAGNVHYSDKLPPSAPAKGHQELRKDGIEKNSVAPPKPPEAYLHEQEAERVRLEQQRLVEQQQAADRILIGAYRTEDDLLLTRDGKLAAVDAVTRVTLSTLQGQKRQLLDLQREAAGQVQRGQPVPEALRRRIAETEQTLIASYESIVRREQEKDRIRADFDQVLSRFRALKGPGTQVPPKASVIPAASPPGFADLDAAIRCTDPSSCQAFWVRAKTYVEQWATTPVQHFGSHIHMTALPRGDQDVSLTLAWIPNLNDQGGVLFLDLQCNGSPLGKQFCTSPEVEKIRKGFKPYLQKSP